MEKTRGHRSRSVPFVRLMAVLPMGVPGDGPGPRDTSSSSCPEGNPLHFMYGSMAILVFCTTVHYYTSSHLTAVTALKQIDNEFEAVSASLRVPFWRTFFR
jgi:iron(III) transport system permease protein